MPVFDCTYTCQERWPHILPYIDKYSVISWGIRFYAFSSVLKTDLTDCLLLKPNHLKSKTIKWSQIPLLKHTVCFPVQQVLLSFHVSCHSCHVHLFWPCLHPCSVTGLFPPCLCFSAYIYTAIMKSCQCCFALLSLVCSSVFSRSTVVTCIVFPGFDHPFCSHLRLWIFLVCICLPFIYPLWTVSMISWITLNEQHAHFTQICPASNICMYCFRGFRQVIELWAQV